MTTMQRDALTVKMKMTVMSVTGMMILAMMAAALVQRYLIHIPSVTGATSLEEISSFKPGFEPTTVPSEVREGSSSLNQTIRQVVRTDLQH